ncbi:ABC transporter permease [Bacteroidia bacterium]|nr:ABC transporter permease [Bacteroidia bacterium]GHT49086.1 ABC transporter permease [Bacteroidia bacterium]
MVQTKGSDNELKITNMIKHYLTVAFRNMWKYKLQSLMGITGLALGISFSSLGYYWLRYETSYDGFYPESKRIYQLYGVDKQSGDKTALLPFIVAEKLMTDFPETEKVAPIYPNTGSAIKEGDKMLTINPKFQFVDEFFLELFPPEIIAGKSEHLLYAPEDLVVTETFVRKFWETPEDAIGKTLTDGYRSTLNIVAVIKDAPSNSNFQNEGYRVDIFRRMMEKQAETEKRWFLNDNQIFILLNKNADLKAFQDKIKDYVTENSTNDKLQLYITPITQTRHELGTDLSFNINYIRIFSAAGLLLLFCAVFNFVNLFLNRLFQRGKELKLRKTVGGNNYSLTKQFQVELGLHLFLILPLGMFFLLVFRPFFEELFKISIEGCEIYSLFFILAAVIFILLFLICILSESGFIRFSSLSQIYSKYNNRNFRNFSICVQLAICVFSLTYAFVYYRQISYMGDFDRGFKSEGIIRMKMDSRDRTSITQAIASLPSVREFIPTGLFNIREEPFFVHGEVSWEGKSDAQSSKVQIFDVTENFFTGLEIPLLKGRLFQEEDMVTPEGYYSPTSDKILITNSMAQLIGKENPIGEKLQVPTNSMINGVFQTQEKEIIGVVKDIHVSSLKNPIYPMILKYEGRKWEGYYNYVKAVFGIYSISSSNMERHRKEIAIRKIAGATTKDMIDKYLKEYSVLLLASNIVSLPFACYFAHNWLLNYSNRMSLGIGMFLLVLVITFALVILTVFYQVYKVANQNPAEVIKTE